MKKALGIDEHKKEHSEYRSWEGLRHFFSEKLKELDDLSEKSAEMSAKDLLQCKAFAKVKSGVEHQLTSMDFFTAPDKVSAESLKLMQSSNVLTNSGCEGQFADLDNMIQKSGGSCSLSRHSQKHVVTKTKLFEKESWKSLSNDDKTLEFRWARNSDQCKKADNIEEDWIKKVEDSKKEITKLKAEVKKKKNIRTLKVLEQCKGHGGPITSPSELKNLEELTENQILKEVAYIRLTVNSSIKQRRKVNGKYVRFTKSELISQIQNTLCPEDNVYDDLEKLLVDVFAKL